MATSYTSLLILFAICVLAPGWSSAGENNWVSFVINNNSSQSIYIDDAMLEYGKWHKTGVKSFEYATVNQEIPPFKYVRINACGRMLSPTGTNGQFSLFTKPKKELMSEEIAFFVFEVYFIAEQNLFSVPYIHRDYKLKTSSYKKHGADMGIINIIINKK